MYKSSFGRFLEIAISSVLLLMFLPVLVCCYIMIVILSGETALIAHARVGQYGKQIWILKLRTLLDVGSPRPNRRRFALVDYVEGEQTEKNTPKKSMRGYFLATFLRRTSLDEMPQLLQVITGTLTLVGPRPATQSEIELFYGKNYEKIRAVKPGVTGLWQVTGRHRIPPDKRALVDIEYLENRCLALDIRILMKTVLCVIRLDGL
jgi:lipopolysaccharide/colanic/teichoic acid biosynthesis glycosyltransferase